MEVEKGPWHLDKRFSIGNLLTMLGGFVGVLMYVASLKAQIQIQGTELNHLQTDMEKSERGTQKEFGEVKEQIEGVQGDIEQVRVEAKEDRRQIMEQLQKLVDRELNGG